MRPEEVSSAPQQADAGAVGTPAAMSSGASSSAPVGPAAMPASTPVQADDADVLEDAWIEVVERIVKEQRHDPYTLNRAMTLARADYMKKRYNREVKIPD